MKTFNLLIFLLLSLITTKQVFANDYRRDLRIGEIVFLKEKNSFVKVQSYSGGTYTVLFTSGANSGKLGRGWLRSDLALTESCTLKVCTGAIVRDQKLNLTAEVIAIDSDGYLVIKASEEQVWIDVSEKNVTIIKSNKNGSAHTNPSVRHTEPASPVNISNPNTSDLSYNRKLQIGDEVIIIEKNLNAKVDDIVNGTFNVKITEGPNVGKIGRGWLRSDLALIQACNGSFCTGKKYFFKSENSVVLINAIDVEGYFIVTAQTGAKAGTQWKDVAVSKLSNIENQPNTSNSVAGKPTQPVVLPPVANTNKNYFDLPIK